MVRLRGGIAPNIAYTLALLGQRPRVWAAVGEDFEEYRAWLENHGVDTSGMKVIAGEYTASFFVNTDRANAQIASFYPGAMGHAASLTLYDETIGKPDLVLISPNDPAAMTLYVKECQEIGLPYVYDPSQQIVRLRPDELRQGIEAAQSLFINEYEAALVEKHTGLTPAAIVSRPSAPHGVFVVVTRGKEGASIYEDELRIDVPVINTEAMIDPTGVGDAFRGGFLTGYSEGLDLETCGRMGALAATYCLEQRGPQGQHYTPAQFVARYREYYDDHGKLDVLLAHSNERL
jgi:adenosine kinase